MTNGSTWTKLDGSLFVGPGTSIKWAWRMLEANGRTPAERVTLITQWLMRRAKSHIRRTRYGRA